MPDSAIARKSACEMKRCKTPKLMIDRETDRVKALNNKLLDEIRDLTKQFASRKVDRAEYKKKTTQMTNKMKENYKTIPDKVIKDINVCLTKMCKSETEAFINSILETIKGFCTKDAMKTAAGKKLCGMEGIVKKEMKKGILPAYGYTGFL